MECNRAEVAAPTAQVAAPSAAADPAADSERDSDDDDRGLLEASMSGYGEVETGKHSLLHLATRRALRWIRVRYLL